MTRVAEAADARYLLHRQLFGIDEQLLGFYYAGTVNVVQRRATEMVFEQPFEAAAADAGDLCQLVDVEIFLQMFPDVLGGSGNMRLLHGDDVC